MLAPACSLLKWLLVLDISATCFHAPLVQSSG